MQAAMRPKGVILKYKELIRQAQRDESVLVALENELRQIELEQAKVKDPWKLITKPTLSKYPVAPKRRNIGFTGLLIGFFFGSIICFLKERKSGKIFELQMLEKILAAQLIDKISITDDFFKSKKEIFLKEFIRNQSKKKLCFISLNKVEENYVKELKNSIIDEEIGREIKLYSSLDDLNYSISGYHLILFISFNSAKYNDIRNLQNRLRLLNLKLDGFVLLTDS